MRALSVAVIAIAAVLATPACDDACTRRAACCRAVPANLPDPVRGLVCWSTSHTNAECSRDLGALRTRLGDRPVPAACR